jgi:hypothetical protein
MTRDSMVKPTSGIVRNLRNLAAGSVLAGALLVLTGQGCATEGVGDPCTPEQEYNASFLGFSQGEVSVESKSFQCRSRLCLVNHFRGRVTCPYGQQENGEAPAGGKSCTVPGTADKPIKGATYPDPVTGKEEFIDKDKKSSVEPQCLDRKAADAVYCSCRCADINGQRPSDQAFCDCPDGFTCERLVTTIGQGNEGLTGSYCIKAGTKYDEVTSCTTGACDKNDKTRNCD